MQHKSGFGIINKITEADNVGPSFKSLWTCWLGGNKEGIMAWLLDILVAEGQGK